MLKTATSLAFATACLTALATVPGAQAQSANTNAPNGSMYQNQMPQSPQSTTNWSGGGYGSTSGNYTPSSSAGGEQLLTNGPQSNGVENSGNWSARENVIQSRHYTHLLQSSAAFRHVRTRKECGPITDPQLHANCVASFSQYSPPMYGSSQGPTNYGNGSGS